MIELSTKDSVGTQGYEVVVWPNRLEGSHSIRANIDSCLSCFGTVPTQAIDFVRIAFAALIADRRTRRPASWSRTLGIRVHVIDPHEWDDGLPLLAELLGFLTGDEWHIDLVLDTNTCKVEAERPDTVERSILFSGGLDSFAGAVIALNNVLPKVGGSPLPLFVSHQDNNIVAASQKRTGDWLRQNISNLFSATTCRLAPSLRVIEPSSRCRSLLFISLGCAAALARRGSILEMPENGFTSINPPLRDDRAGTLSTRSTHPSTIILVNRLLETLHLNIVVRNPFEWYTKGELVREAVQHAPHNIVEGIAKTLSCSKLDGWLYRGGDPNLNCGLCVSCLVRRASIIAANIEDRTPYLITQLEGAARDNLIHRRQRDILAVRNAIATGVDEDALIGSMPLPVNCDIDRVVDLCQRSLKELGHVDLP